MSIVTACIRPSGASYRDDLLARKTHKNPSELIDEALSDSAGFLIYQEQTIKFLQDVCGLSGSASDNIRRAIGRKQKDRLDAALPAILDGYCRKSTKPREEAEKEAKEFLQVIEDSASYQFGWNCVQLKPCENGQLSRKAKVVREPKSVRIWQYRDKPQMWKV